jgi:hypothetical protein
MAWSRTTLWRWRGGRKPRWGTIPAPIALGYIHGLFSLPKNAHCAKIFMMAAAVHGHVEAIDDLKLLRACAACGAPDASRT